jgi:hypothetical protein
VTVRVSLAQPAVAKFALNLTERNSLAVKVRLVEEKTLAEMIVVGEPTKVAVELHSLVPGTISDMIDSKEGEEKGKRKNKKSVRRLEHN